MVGGGGGGRRGTEWKIYRGKITRTERKWGRRIRTERMQRGREKK
jgi:hypothetical protein